MDKQENHTSNSTITNDPLRLTWSETERTVVLEPKDEDRFCMKVQEVIRACGIFQGVEEFERQFVDLKNILGNWVHSNRDKISKAFVTVRDTQMLFLPITKDFVYDSQFEAELTKLDLDIAHSPLFSSMSFGVQSLPECDTDSYEAFLAPPTILEYRLD